MVLVTGCSVIRKTAKENVSGGRGKAISVENLKKSNMTGSDFQIQKAQITINGEGGEEKLTANMKYREPGTWLVSLRSLTGIEAARFFISDDTILVNDRLNKKVYHGSAEYLMNKYGLSIKYLPVILGDIITEGTDIEDINCSENKAVIIERNGESNINYKIDCSTGKVRYVTIENSLSGQIINISLEKFIKGDEVNYYRNIRITDQGEHNQIKIKIERISRLGVNNLDFIPGKNYEDVILR